MFKVQYSKTNEKGKKEEKKENIIINGEVEKRKGKIEIKGLNAPSSVDNYTADGLNTYISCTPESCRTLYTPERVGSLRTH